MAKRGRKGYEHEIKQKELWNLSTNILINALNDKKQAIDPVERRRIALEIVKKMMPSDFNISSESVEKVVNIDFTKMDRAELREFLRSKLSK